MLQSELSEKKNEVLELRPTVEGARESEIRLLDARKHLAECQAETSCLKDEIRRQDIIIQGLMAAKAASVSTHPPGRGGRKMNAHNNDTNNINDSGKLTT